MTEQLIRFRQEVLYMLAQISRKSLEQELGSELRARHLALANFWERWLAHPRIGRPSRDKLEALAYAASEPGWLGRYETVPMAVAHLRESIRSRSKPIIALVLKEELVTAQGLGEEIGDLSSALSNLDEVCRAYVDERLAGHTWDRAAVNLGHDLATMRRHRRKLRSILRTSGSYTPDNPKRVRAR